MLVLAADHLTELPTASPMEHLKDGLPIVPRRLLYALAALGVRLSRHRAIGDDRHHSHREEGAGDEQAEDSARDPGAEKSGVDAHGSPTGLIL